MKLPDKVYDVLKWVCLIAFPAIATLYGQLAEIWGLPFGEQIPQTIGYIAVFIGILIGVSTYNHNKEQ